jgi:hypothetical protein
MFLGGETPQVEEDLAANERPAGREKINKKFSMGNGATR